jgi:RimJ/RimL family protein N-acetyltransferase
MTIPEIRTERLLLRGFRSSDFDALSAFNADPEVSRYLGDGRALDRVDSWRQLAFFLGHWELRGYGMWALEIVETGEMIGRVGFMDPEGWPGFELGWVLARLHWGQGYASEAASTALRYAFEELGRALVISLIRPENHASIRVAERIGETQLGTTELMGGPALVYGAEKISFDE